jgi:hypothetical protein
MWTGTPYDRWQKRLGVTLFALGILTAPLVVLQAPLWLITAIFLVICAVFAAMTGLLALKKLYIAYARQRGIMFDDY